MSESLPPVKFNGKKFLGLQNPLCDDVIDSSDPLPEMLTKLYPSTDIKDAIECLVVLQHVLMLESGYLPVDVSEDKQFDELPPNWKEQHSNHVYKICYTHKLCPDAKCQMSCILLGPMLGTYGTILNTSKEQYASKNMMIQTSLYLRKTNTYDDITAVYSNMSQLARDFKYLFASPLLQDIFYAFDVEPNIGLSNLPTDLKFSILSFLPAEALVAMSAVNKEFHGIANSSFLWKPLYLRYFPQEVPSNTNESHKWKELYVTEYKKMKEIAKLYKPLSPRNFPSDQRNPWYHPPICRPPRHGYVPRTTLPPEIEQAFPALARRYYPVNPLLSRVIPPPHPFI